MNINKEIIQLNLSNIKVEYLETCSSTNKILKNSTDKIDILLITNEQTSGVGRLNRNFVSNKGKGIYMSLLVNKEIDLKLVSKITPITAVVVSNSINEFIDEPTYIKWVNDIYLKNKKICGILVESVINNNKLDKLIIGIGINVYKQKFDEELSLKASTIEDLTNTKISRNELIISIINKLKYALDHLDDISYMQEYVSKSNLINKEVVVNYNEKDYNAKVLDITLDGELVVQINNEILSLNTAEVTKITF